MHGGGGSVPMSYPFQTSTLLEGSARTDAGVATYDQYFKDSQTAIPADMRITQSGGGLLAPASLSSPDMLLSSSETANALNPQWNTEARTNPEIGRMAQAEAAYRSTNYSDPAFRGPTNAYATQAGGRRSTRRKCRDRRGSRRDRSSRNRRGSRRDRRSKH